MNKGKKEKTSVEKWAALTEAADAMEAERVAELSDEEIDASLRAAGLDPAKVAAEGEALVARLMREAGIHATADAADPEPAPVSGPAPAPSPEPDRPPARPILAEVVPFREPRRVMWPYYGLAAAAAVLAIVALRRPPSVPDDPSQREVAAKLRDEAKTQCAEGAWRTCVDTLNRARDVDLVGDESAEVQELRAAAAKALAPAPTPAPTVPPKREPAPDEDRKTPPKGDKVP